MNEDQMRREKREAEAAKAAKAAKHPWIRRALVAAQQDMWLRLFGVKYYTA